MQPTKAIIILLFLLAFTSISIAAEPGDSLVRFKDLSFASEYEEGIFTSINSGLDVPMIDIYLAIDAQSESEAARYKTQFEVLLKELENQGIRDKKEKKQAKAIYLHVHESLMRHYEEVVDFPDLWRTGDFNCVTGSIVYSLVFAEYGIPYLVHKGKNHVFLVAHPESHTIIIESTDSQDGYIVVGSNAKKNYVDLLSQGKMVTESELAHQGMDQVFLKYAHKENEINDMGLASVQYYNRGLFNFGEKDFRKAYELFQKAYYLSPDELLEPLLMLTGGMVLHMSSYENLQDVYLICQMSRFAEHGITNDDILGEFARVTRKIIVDREDPKKYTRAYEILMEGIEEKELRDDISELYFGAMVNALLEQGNTDETDAYLHELYQLDSTNLEVKNLIFSNLVEDMENEYYKDPDSLMYFISRQREVYPEVFRMSEMENLEFALVLNATMELFDNGDVARGEAYLERFERDYAPHARRIRINQNAQLIQQTYETAAYYYYARGNTRKTRETLDRGLTILPGNRRLSYMKNSL